MATSSSTTAKKAFIFSVICLCMLSISNGSGSLLNSSILPVRAVFLGGWLAVEGGIKPSLFDAIPNPDFLDGRQLQFQSVTVRKYLSAEPGRGATVVASAQAPSGWETFRLWRMNETSFNFRVSSGKFVGLGNGVDVVATAEHEPGPSETFQILRNPNDPKRVRIKASNGFFLQVKTDEQVTADYRGNTSDGWGDDNPSVFLLKMTGKKLRGEYQLTNGLGPLLAPQVMKDHWRTFVVEEDFKFMKENGVNAVRIPVGWWIASDPSPPKLYVAGSLQALDNAFVWAEKYGIKVIVDLHAVPGSQNGWEYSGTRDGSLDWGKTDASIQQTVNVIEFLTARYAKSPSLLAMQLLNEPLAPGVPLDILTRYYTDGYYAVRKHSTTAYVVFGIRLGPAHPRELFSLTNGLTKSVIGVHYFNVFSDMFDGFKTAQQHIDYVYNKRAAQLNEITTPSGPLVFVGEWTGAMPDRVDLTVTREEKERFVKSQLDVFGQATFGWAYALLKTETPHDKYWSMTWMIKNGYIKL